MTGITSLIVIKSEATGGMHMEWIVGIQNAIDYIENNITEVMICFQEERETIEFLLLQL